MSLPHRSSRILGAAAMLALLAGCAAPAPVETEAAPEPTPTPTPTYVQPAEPVSTLPLDCADFGGLAAIQASFSEPLQVQVDEASAPRGSYLAEYIQAGGLTCVWGGEDKTDGGWDQGLTLSILSDAADVYATYVATRPTDGAQIDTLGDGSSFRCDVFSPGYQCYGDVLVDGYWVDARVGDSANGDEAVEQFTAVVGSVVDAVRAAGDPRPSWIPPSESFSGEALCSDATAAAAALGTSADALTVRVLGADDPYQTSEATRRSGSANCTWGTASTSYALSITTVPGGSWAMKRYLAQPDVPFGGLQARPQTVSLPGTDAARLSCGDGCAAVMEVGGSIVYLYLGETYDVPQATAQATAFAEALAAG